MATKRYEASQPIQLHVIRCEGPLTVQGWDRPAIEIQVQGPSDDLKDTWEGTKLTISAQGPCTIHCPADTDVHMGHVDGPLSVAELDQTVRVDVCQGSVLLRALRAMGNLHQVDGSLHARSIGGGLQMGKISGNASLKSVEGSVAAERVEGTLTVRRLAGDLSAQSVGGDLRAWRVEGSLSIRQVAGSLRADGIRGELDAEMIGGTARIHDLRGTLTLKKVGGHVRASILLGGMDVAQVGGDLRLDGLLVPGESYRGEAIGNVTLRLPTSTSARLDLTAQGRIHTDLPLTSAESRDPSHLVGLLGDGAATVLINARGSIRILEWTGSEAETIGWVQDLEGLAEEIDRQVTDALRDVDFASIGQQIDQQVNEALRDVDFASIGRQIESRMAWAERKLKSVDWERLGEEARKAAEAGVTQAQEAIQQALIRMEAWSIDRTTPGSSAVDERTPKPAPPTEREPTDEERMAILRMVERGQITPDEGEMLLDALEGA